MKLKRILLSFTLLAGLLCFSDAVSRAEGASPRLVPDVNDVIGPSKTTLNLFASTGTFVTISSTPTYRICLTSLEVSPLNNTTTLTGYQVNLLTGGTTTYSVAVSTTGASIPGGFNRTWPETNPWCADRSQAATITGTALNNAGITVNVNYQGFTQVR